MADFLTEQRSALEKRLKELRPLYDEYMNLERVKDALHGVTGRGPGRPRASSSATGTKRGPGRPKGSTTRRRSTNGRRRRSRRGGTRAEQALKVIRENPGITVTELAKKLNVKQKNYLYRVMNQLQADGTVTKRGKGYSAKK